MKARKARVVTIKKEHFEHPDIYNRNFLDESLEDDMISITEQGFMMGYLGGYDV